MLLHLLKIECSLNSWGSHGALQHSWCEPSAEAAGVGRGSNAHITTAGSFCGGRAVDLRDFHFLKSKQINILHKMPMNVMSLYIENRNCKSNCVVL